MRTLLTAEVNAAVTGSFEGGATEVVVNDSHGSGYNILFENLDPRCKIIHGLNCSGPHWLPELDESFDAMVLIGMHAMAGTENALVSHSKWEVNEGELYFSESTMAAAMAGDFNVPTILVSGDDKIIAEVSEKIPGICSIVVKKGLGAYQAKSLIPVKACELFNTNTCSAVKNYKSVAPYKIKGPVSLNLLESKEHSPPLQYMKDKAVIADTINEAFIEFEKVWTGIPDM